MPFHWKLFRTICIAQLIAAAFNILDTLFDFFRYASWSGLIGLALFLAIMFLAVLAIHILNNNYPDEPVEGKQKKSFNRLFLINFSSLSFLFGFIISEFRSLNHLTTITGKTFFDFSFGIFMMLLIYVGMLIFQLIILYGLYKLRLELYSNFMKRKFDFENS